MLVLKRKIGQSLLIDGRILVKVLGTERGSAFIGIEAPRNVPVMREEILDPQFTRPASRPRYAVLSAKDGYGVHDRVKSVVVCVVPTVDLAARIAQDLNQGLAETVTPEGQWAEEGA